MKTFLVIGSVVVVLGLLIAGLVTPVFAHGSDDDHASEEAWQAMHEACESGDWEAMIDAAREVHGEDFSHMDGGHMDGDHTGGGMMGGGMMGGMMGGW